MRFVDDDTIRLLLAHPDECTCQRCIARANSNGAEPVAGCRCGECQPGQRSLPMSDEDAEFLEMEEAIRDLECRD